MTAFEKFQADIEERRRAFVNENMGPSAVRKFYNDDTAKLLAIVKVLSEALHECRRKCNVPDHQQGCDVQLRVGRALAEAEELSK